MISLKKLPRQVIDFLLKQCCNLLNSSLTAIKKEKSQTFIKIICICFWFHHNERSFYLCLRSWLRHRCLFHRHILIQILKHRQLTWKRVNWNCRLCKFLLINLQISVRKWQVIDQLRVKKLAKKRLKLSSFNSFVLDYSKLIGKKEFFYTFMGVFVVRFKFSKGFLEVFAFNVDPHHTVIVIFFKPFGDVLSRIKSFSTPLVLNETRMHQTMCHTKEVFFKRLRNKFRHLLTRPCKSEHLSACNLKII